MEKLSKEEKMILDDFDKGLFKRVKNADKEKKRYQEYAKRTLSKLSNAAKQRD